MKKIDSIKKAFNEYDKNPDMKEETLVDKIRKILKEEGLEE